MKTKRFFSAIVVLMLLFFFSCKSQDSGSKVTEVENATYSMYDFADEKGYTVNFELKNSANLPIAVIVNGITQKVSLVKSSTGTYTANVVSQSRKIHNFGPEMTDRPNGFLFLSNGKEVFQPVNFTLKTH